MNSIWEGIIIGAVGGSLAGLTLWMVEYVHTKVVEYMHKSRVHTWLEKNIGREHGDFRTTRAIASYNNLTEDRVRYICSIDKRIHLSTGPNEDRWTISSEHGGQQARRLGRNAKG